MGASQRHLERAGSSSTGVTSDTSQQQQPPEQQQLAAFWSRRLPPALLGGTGIGPGSSTAAAWQAAAGGAAGAAAATNNPLQQLLKQQQEQQQAAGLGGSAAAAAAAAAAATAAAAPLSRYRSDFAELRRLGRGGFGVVVAAINRWVGSFTMCSFTGWKCETKHAQPAQQHTPYCPDRLPPPSHTSSNTSPPPSTSCLQAGWAPVRGEEDCAAGGGAWRVGVCAHPAGGVHPEPPAAPQRGALLPGEGGGSGGTGTRWRGGRRKG